jgi:hypothetical protein
MVMGGFAVVCVRLWRLVKVVTNYAFGKVLGGCSWHNEF